MAAYAMICENRVIEVLYDLEAAPNWPPDPSGNPVTSVECPAETTRDWAYNPETGEVFKPIPVEPEPEEPITPEPTQMDRIEEMLNNLTSGTISADGIAEAIAEGVNEV